MENSQHITKVKAPFWLQLLYQSVSSRDEHLDVKQEVKTEFWKLSFLFAFSFLFLPEVHTLVAHMGAGPIGFSRHDLNRLLLLTTKTNHPTPSSNTSTQTASSFNIDSHDTYQHDNWTFKVVLHCGPQFMNLDLSCWFRRQHVHMAGCLARSDMNQERLCHLDLHQWHLDPHRSQRTFAVTYFVINALRRNWHWCRI